MQVGYKNRKSCMGASLYKHLELFFMVMANVDYKNGELILKDEYFGLDQSEKVGVSYQIGQGLTKAVAEEYFNVPWVTHVKAMKNMGCQFIPGGSKKISINPSVNSGVEPDLIGYDKKCNAHLFEAKGSSMCSMRTDTIQRAINQVSNYGSFIDLSGTQKTFITRNACLFNFRPCFLGEIIDPPIDRENEIKSIGFLQCLYDYYYYFLYNSEKRFETIREFNQEWSGYIFLFENQKYFWGMNSLYREFLKEQFWDYALDNVDFLKAQIKNEDMKKVDIILDFFNEKRYDHYRYNENEDVSIGEDGYILCKLN
jgi:hypothetical protein